jgi:hypothetical protein
MGCAGEPWVAIYSATRRDNLVNKSIFKETKTTIWSTRALEMTWQMFM